MADVNRTANTTLTVTAEGAAQGAAVFEAASKRITRANENMVRATERSDKALATISKASEKAGKAQAALANAEARAAQVSATSGASAEKVAKATQDVEKARARAVKATEAVAAAEARAVKASEGVAAAQTDVAKAQEMAALGNERNEVSIGDQVKQLERMRRQLDPTYDATVKLAQGTAFLDKQLREQRIGAEEHGKLIEQLKDAYGDVDDAANGTAESTGAVAQRMKNLGYQLSDTVSSLGSGSNAMTILIQQGPQVADAFGGIPHLIGKIPASARIAAAGLLAIGVAAAVVAARMSEIASQQRRLEAIGKTINPTFAGMSAQLRGLTQAIKAAGASSADAAAATEALARMRDMSGELAQQLGPLAVDVAAILGTTVPEAVGKLGDAFTRGSTGIKDLNKDLHFLGPEELKEVARLEKQGHSAEMLALALSKLSAMYKGKALEMESSWGNAMRSIGDAWDRMLERIGNDQGVRDAGNVVSHIFDWFTETFSPDLTKPAEQEISRLTAELAAAKKIADQLAASVASGVGVIGDPVGEAVQRVIDLTDKLDKLKAAQKAAQPPDQAGPPLAKAEPSVNAEGLTEDQAIEAGRLRKIYEEQTAALKGNARERQIAQAGLEAYNSAMERHGDTTLAAIERDIAMKAARRDIAIAIGDENAALDLNIKNTLKVAEAYRISTEAGLRAEAMAQGLADAQASGVDAATRANQLLQQSSTEAFKSAAQDLDRLKSDVANLPDILKGVQGGPAAEEEARRKAEAEAMFRDRIAAAEAARNSTMVEQLKQERTETEGVLKVRDDYNRKIATAQQFREGAEKDTERIKLEARLIGATNEVREREIGLLELRQQLVAAGYKGTELEAEFARLSKFVELQAKLSDQTRKATEEFERNKQAISDGVDILNDGFNDLVMNGESFNDVLKNMSKAFLRLGQDVLVMGPLKRWLNDTMNSSASGGGGTNIWSMLSSIGSAALSAWSGAPAAGAAGVTTATAGGFGGAPVLPVTSVPLAHTGWHVGMEAPRQTRTVPTSVFVNAPRLHQGGMGPGEFGAILQRGEEVLTARNPRHRNNFRGGGPSVVMNISTPDANSFRQSQGQITAAAARSFAIAGRRNG